MLSKYKPQPSVGMLEDVASYKFPGVSGKLLVKWRLWNNHDQTIPEVELPRVQVGELLVSTLEDLPFCSALRSGSLVLESDLVGIRHWDGQAAQLSPVVSGLG